MTRFEEIRVSYQQNATSRRAAKRSFQISCNICCNRGYRIECDRCAIASSHEIALNAFDTLEKMREIERLNLTRRQVDLIVESKSSFAAIDKQV